MRSVEIFHTENGNTEAWLEVNEDGTVTYHRENAGWRMRRHDMEARNSTYTVDEAKKRWTSYASEINKAVETLKIGKSN